MSETLGLLLVRSGAITREALYQALELQRQSGRFLGSCLLALGAVAPDALKQALAKQLGLEIADGRDVLRADPSLASYVPLDVVSRYRVVPFALNSEGLLLALYDPNASDSLSEIEFFTGYRVWPHLCEEAVVERAIAALYPSEARSMTRLPQAQPQTVDGVVASAAPAGVPVPASALVVLDERAEQGAALSEAPAPDTLIPPGGGLPSAAMVPSSGDTLVDPLPPIKPRPAGMAPAPIELERPSSPRPDRRRPGELLRPIEEISNSDFGAALGLDDQAESVAPIPLTQVVKRVIREVTQGPILSVMDAAEKVFDTSDLLDIAEVGARFLRNFFDRIAVFEIGAGRGLALARLGFVHTVDELQVGSESPLAEVLRSQQLFHGPAPRDRHWAELFTLFGDVMPGTVLVSAVSDSQGPKLLFYADTQRPEPYDDLHDVAVLMREITTALSLLGESPA